MSLYSSSLCGLILLVPKRIRLTTADIKEGKTQIFIWKDLLFCLEFASVCERSTDFHFPSFEQQLSNIEDCLQQASQARSAAASNSLDSNSISSKQSDASSEVIHNILGLHPFISIDLGSKSLFCGRFLHHTSFQSIRSSCSLSFSCQ